MSEARRFVRNLRERGASIFVATLQKNGFKDRAIFFSSWWTLKTTLISKDGGRWRNYFILDVSGTFKKIFIYTFWWHTNHLLKKKTLKWSLCIFFLHITKTNYISARRNIELQYIWNTESLHLPCASELFKKVWVFVGACESPARHKRRTKRKPKQKRPTTQFLSSS